MPDNRKSHNPEGWMRESANSATNARNFSAPYDMDMTVAQLLDAKAAKYKRRSFQWHRKKEENARQAMLYGSGSPSAQPQRRGAAEETFLSTKAKARVRRQWRISPVLVAVLIVLLLLVLWVGIGVLMNYGVLPQYDIGYEWLRGLLQGGA